jgi:hypothetical protein
MTAARRLSPLCHDGILGAHWGVRLPSQRGNPPGLEPGHRSTADSPGEARGLGECHPGSLCGHTLDIRPTRTSQHLNDRISSTPYRPA